MAIVKFTLQDLHQYLKLYQKSFIEVVDNEPENGDLFTTFFSIK